MPDKQWNIVCNGRLFAAMCFAAFLYLQSPLWLIVLPVASVGAAYLSEAFENDQPMASWVINVACLLSGALSFIALSIVVI